MGNGNITRMIRYSGTGERSVIEWVQVVLVTGWPKEETWDGEVGKDINCIECCTLYFIVYEWCG